MTDEQTTAKFLRGLTLGAIIGAIIAGSSFWTRRRRAARPEARAVSAMEASTRETRVDG